MQLQRIWILRGANVWARCPVLEVELDLADCTAVNEDRLAACTARLRPGCRPSPIIPSVPIFPLSSAI